MEDFWMALVKGALQLYGQYKINQSVMNQQNEYNEQMYNKYSSPDSQARQLRNAGMSDAGIGSALSGFSGAGTVIQSAPMETPQLADLFADIGQLKGNKLTESEIDLNEAKRKVESMSAEKLAAEYYKINDEAELLRQKRLISNQELDIMKRSADALVKMNENQAKKVLVEIADLMAKIQIAEDQHKINTADILKKELDAQYIKNFGIEKEDLDTSNPFKLGGLLFKLILGQGFAENGLLNPNN